MFNTEVAVEPVETVAAAAILDQKSRYPHDVSADIYYTVKSMMDQAIRARHAMIEFDFEEFTNFLDTITAGELFWFLCTEEEDIQLETLNEWIDELAAQNPSNTAA